MNNLNNNIIPLTLDVPIWIVVNMINYDLDRISFYKSKEKEAPWKKKPSDYTKDNYEQLIVTSSELFKRDSFKLKILVDEFLDSIDKI